MRGWSAGGGQSAKIEKGRRSGHRNDTINIIVQLTSVLHFRKARNLMIDRNRVFMHDFSFRMRADISIHHPNT
jgi:hypothetical protein